MLQVRIHSPAPRPSLVARFMHTCIPATREGLGEKSSILAAGPLLAVNNNPSPPGCSSLSCARAQRSSPPPTAHPSPHIPFPTVTLARRSVAATFFARRALFAQHTTRRRLPNSIYTNSVRLGSCSVTLRHRPAAAGQGILCARRPFLGLAVTEDCNRPYAETARIGAQLAAQRTHRT